MIDHVKKGDMSAESDDMRVSGASLETKQLLEIQSQQDSARERMISRLSSRTLDLSQEQENNKDMDEEVPVCVSTEAPNPFGRSGSFKPNTPRSVVVESFREDSNDSNDGNETGCDDDINVMTGNRINGTDSSVGERAAQELGGRRMSNPQGSRRMSNPQSNTSQLVTNDQTIVEEPETTQEN